MMTVVMSSPVQLLVILGWTAVRRYLMIVVFSSIAVWKVCCALSVPVAVLMQLRHAVCLAYSVFAEPPVSGHVVVCSVEYCLGTPGGSCIVAREVQPVGEERTTAKCVVCVL